MAALFLTFVPFERVFAEETKGCPGEWCTTDANDKKICIFNGVPDEWCSCCPTNPTPIGG